MWLPTRATQTALRKASKLSMREGRVGCSKAILAVFQRKYFGTNVALLCTLPIFAATMHLVRRSIKTSTMPILYICISPQTWRMFLGKLEAALRAHGENRRKARRRLPACSKWSGVPTRLVPFRHPNPPIPSESLSRPLGESKSGGCGC